MPDAETPPVSPDLDRQLKMLGELAELGLEQARALDRRIRQADPEPSLAELETAALAYTRISRAVRMAILLQSELVGRGEAGLGARRKALAEQRARRVARVVDVVKRTALQAHGPDPDIVFSYGHEAAERLETDDIYGDVMTRPLGEIIARICDDLQLEPDWDSLSVEAWAEAEAASGAEGSPFVEAPFTSPMRSMAGGGPPPEEGVVEGAGLSHDRDRFALLNSS